MEEFSNDAGTLPPDHPKLKAFQAAVRQVLIRRIAEAQALNKELRKSNEAKREEREEKTKALFASQKKLQAEEEKLEAITQEVKTIAKRRKDLEAKNRKQAEKLASREADLQRLNKKRDALREEHNALLAAVIASEARRVQMAGGVGAEQTVATASDAEYKRLQEEKGVQDMYLENLRSTAEDLELRNREYQEQKAAMEEKTTELMHTVRSAEAECERIRGEKQKLVQKWQSSVINVSKRDDAVAAFEGALKEQEIELRGKKAEIGGARAEVIHCQEQHDQLTGVERRVERLCAARQSQIRSAEEAIAEVKRALSRAVKAKASTAKTLGVSKEELRMCEIELSNAERRVAKMDAERKALEDELFVMGRERLTAEKRSKYADRIIIDLRDEASKLETSLTAARSSMSTTEQRTAEEAAALKAEQAFENSLRQEITSLSKESERLRELVARTQAMVDKRQNVIELRQREQKELEVASATTLEDVASSPLESEIHKLRTEIEHVKKYCKESKAAWLKRQNELIASTAKKSSVCDDISESSRRLRIVTEKKRKLESEMKAMEESAESMAKRIVARDGAIRRMNGQIHQDHEKYEQTGKTLEDKRVADSDALDKLVDEVAAFKEAVRAMVEELSAEKETALAADKTLAEWEDKVGACKQTHAVVTSERGREGEVEALRAELHRLEMRSEAVSRQTTSLMGVLENSVWRRDAMAEKAAARKLSAIRTHSILAPTKTPQLAKSMENKRRDDAKNMIKKLLKEEKAIQNELVQRTKVVSELTKELEKKESFLRKIRESIQAMDELIEQCNETKDKNLARILQLQTRAKWYRSIGDKRYKLAMKDDEKSALDSLRAQNEDLKAALTKMEAEFPSLKPSLRKINNHLLPPAEEF